MCAEIFGGNGSGDLLDGLWFFFFSNLVLRRRSKSTESQASPLDRRCFCLLLLWVKDALGTRPLWMLTATEFLSFEQHENMVTASVEVVGAVCRHLSWSAYLYHLKHFIHVLQTGQIGTKLGVRWVLWAVLLWVSPKTPKAKFSIFRSITWILGSSLTWEIADFEVDLGKWRWAWLCCLQLWSFNRSLLSYTMSHCVHGSSSSFCFCQAVPAPQTPSLLQYHCPWGFTVS